MAAETPESGWAPTSMKGWQLKPLRREKEDYSGLHLHPVYSQSAYKNGQLE